MSSLTDKTLEFDSFITMLILSSSLILRCLLILSKGAKSIPYAGNNNAGISQTKRKIELQKVTIPKS
jgi:hypothetical protein